MTATRVYTDEIQRLFCKIKKQNRRRLRRNKKAGGLFQTVQPEHRVIGWADLFELRRCAGVSEVDNAGRTTH